MQMSLEEEAGSVGRAGGAGCGPTLLRGRARLCREGKLRLGNSIDPRWDLSEYMSPAQPQESDLSSSMEEACVLPSCSLSHILRKLRRN